MSVRPSHSSPGAGSTRRAIARRASDTTFENVASRTSRSHSAVRARVRVERWRWVASQAISSRVFDRSNTAAWPCSSTTSTGPRRRTSNDQSGTVASPSAVARGSSSRSSSTSSPAEACSTSSVMAVSSSPSRPKGMTSIPSGSSRQVDARSTSVWRAASRDPATTTASPGTATRGERVVDFAHVVGRHEQDRRFPRLAADHPRTQRERRLRRQGRAPEE